MTLTTPLRAIAVSSNTSLSFLRAIFRAYADRQTFVIAGSRDAADRLPGLSIDRFVAVENESGWFDESHPLIAEDGPAQISFTSGTTGTPKGIVLRYDALADTIQRLNGAMQLSPEVREYVGVPASYSFGLARFRAIAAIGGRAFVPPAGFDPLEIARMLRSGDINALSAVPTLLRILIDKPDLIGAAGRRLRWMEIGSQHMTGREKEAIKAIFPEARIIQHYGLTEASRTTFLDISEVEGNALESVGRPVGSTEIAIGDDDRIRIRGPHVARSWIDAKGVHALVDSDGWLTTNDMGVINDGYLYFHGRADDLINCGGIKLVPDVIEERLRIALGIAGGIAVARVPDKSRGDGILVAVENAQARALDDVRDSAKAIIADFGLSPGSALHVIKVDALPVTATGKVQRRVLAQTAEAGGLVSPPDDEDAPSSDDHSLSMAIGQVLGMSAIPADASFASLGGDSLSYIQAGLAVETFLGYAPQNWEVTPIGQLEQMPRKYLSSYDLSGRTKSPISMQSFDLARSSAVMLALLAHCIVQSGASESAWLELVMRLATPMLMFLFGAMIALLHLPRAIHMGEVKSFEVNLSKAIQCYLLFSCNVAAIWFLNPAGWKYALLSFGLLGAMPYAQILLYYLVMFVFLTPLIMAIRTIGFKTLFIISLTIHLLFLPLKAVATLPEIGGQPIYQRMTDLLIGAGNNPVVAGPSIAHSLVFVLGGFWIGSSARLSPDSVSSRLSLIKNQLPLIVIFAASAFLSFFIPGYPVDFASLASMTLRNLNHPAYFFIIGSVCIVILDLLLVSALPKNIPRWFLAMGRRSLFGFGFGNVIIILLPTTPPLDMPSTVYAAVIFISVAFVIYLYDHCIRVGRDTTGPTHFVFEVASMSECIIGKIAARITGTVFRIRT